MIVVIVVGLLLLSSLIGHLNCIDPMFVEMDNNEQYIKLIEAMRPKYWYGITWYGSSNSTLVIDPFVTGTTTLINVDRTSYGWFNGTYNGFSFKEGRIEENSTYSGFHIRFTKNTFCRIHDGEKVAIMYRLSGRKIKDEESTNDIYYLKSIAYIEENTCKIMPIQEEFWSQQPFKGCSYEILKNLDQSH